jgi:hypothetical protein
MKIKTNKTNKKNKTNMGKRNNTRKRNNRRKTSRISRKSNKLTGGQERLSYDPSPFWDTMIPTAEREPIVNQLKYLISGSSKKRSLLCEEVNKLIPAFQNSPYVAIELPEPVAKENGRTQYVIGGISYFVTTDDDVARLKERLQGNAISIWNECNNMTCAALILFGIISSKLQSSGNQFIIAARGGLGIALAGSQLPEDKMIMVPVRDLDFKIIKNQTTARGAFDPWAAGALAQNTCSIVQWFLKQIVSDGYDILLGSPQTANPVGHDAIVKISVKPPSGAFFPILDIAFGYAKDMQYYNGLSEISGFVPIGGGAQLPVSFIFQNVHLMLTEKLYFYAQYLFLRDQLANPGYIESLKSIRGVTTPFGTIAYVRHYGAITFNGASITIQQCNWFLEKFQRSIHLLTNIIVEADDTAIHGLASKQNQVFYSTPPLPRDLRIKVVQSLYPPEPHP